MSNSSQQELRQLPLAPAIDERRVAANWEQIIETRARRARRRRLAPLAALTGVATAAVALLLALATTRGPAVLAPRPLASVDPGASLSPGTVLETRAGELVLDDGSALRLDEHARLQVLANDGVQFVTLMKRGKARFRVSPESKRPWRVETPFATIEVVSTIFVVDQQDERLRVEVERGVVVLRGERVPGRVVRLTEGQKFEVGSAPKSAPSAETTPGPALLPSPPAAPAPEPRASEVRTPQAGAPSPSPQPAVELPPALEEALREADRLRGEGRAREAAEVLERALAADPRGPAAGLAAFTLGRIAAELLDEPERAARAFAQVVQLGGPASLLEEAHVNRVEALLRAGRHRDAEAAIAAYLQAFPAAAERAEQLRARLRGP